MRHASAFQLGATRSSERITAAAAQCGASKERQYRHPPRLPSGGAPGLGHGEAAVQVGDARARRLQSGVFVRVAAGGSRVIF